MNILYTHIHRDYTSPADINLACSHDTMLLEHLHKYQKIQTIFYLTTKPSGGGGGGHISSLDSFNKVVCINNLTDAQQPQAMITDTSNLGFQFAFYFFKPVIYFLPAFDHIVFNNNDKYFTILSSFAVFCHSFKDLRRIINNLDASWSPKALQSFLDGALI